MAEEPSPCPCPQKANIPFLQRVPAPIRAVAVLGVLYLFLASIKLMGEGFNDMGTDFAKKLIEKTQNPFVGLFIGIFVTSMAHSSSLITSIVVGLVAAGTLSVRGAVPIIMGANIGTTVTCTLVSLGYVTRAQEFRRAFASSAMHDLFNLMGVAILLPVELLSRWAFGIGALEFLAEKLTVLLCGSESVTFVGWMKYILDPGVQGARSAIRAIAGTGTFAAWATVIFALGVLFAALISLSKLIGSLIISKFEALLDKTVGRNALFGFLFGLIMTSIIQSSSVTTTMLVPLAATGILDLYQIFPITAGANIGTTVTAVMAAMGGCGAGLTIALVHTLFNTTVAALLVPVPAVRRIPIRLAEGLASLTLRSRWFAVAYVVVVYYAIPGVLIFVT